MARSLRDYDWQSIYESQPSNDAAHLIKEFYVPALERSVQYDRIAGYFDSGSLAAAGNGIEALVENDGRMRLIVGAQLQPKDRPVLEALANDLDENLTGLDDETLDQQLQLLAWLLREDRLELKIAVPSRGEWGIFHPKVGIFRDEDGNWISFEGSINETAGGWTRNYERFKVHRSWDDGQAPYVEGDRESFKQLWQDEHAYVDVYDLPEALKEELIDWKAPDNDVEVSQIVEKLREPEAPTDGDKGRILADGAQAPGGLQLAEEASTIDPWPHQRVVSDTAVNTYPNSYLLCDEVGLGKTIEVGLTLSRLGLTGELENSLVLTPASLAVQWQEELWEKFNINAYRYDRGSDYDYAFIDSFGQEHPVPGTGDLDIDADRRNEAWTNSPLWRFAHTRKDDPTPTVIIMSWHTARLTGRWDQVAPADDGTARTRDDIPASCRGRNPDGREGVWDAVVVDESHNARRGSNFYNLLERLRDHTHCYYLLTATPMQLHHRELYDLLTLLDIPEAWDDRDRFVEFFETRQALSTVIEGGADLSSRTSSDPSQATLNGTFQDRFNSSIEYADVVLEGIVDELGLEDQGRGVAKQRLLQACNLARGYGQEYDDYRRKVDAAIEEQIDPFGADEDTKLKRLLYPESVLNEEMIISSRSDRLDALDELSEDGWKVLQDVLSWATPVDACIHRNTRDTLRKYRKAGLLEETVPTRKPERRRIELNEQTRRVYDRIDEYTRTFYKKAQQSTETEARAIGFVMTTYRQRLTSSVYAISQSLSTRLEKLRTQRKVLERRKRIRDDQDEDRQAALDALSEYSEDEIAELEDAGEDVLNVDLTELAPSLTDEGINLLKEEIEELESFIQEVKQVDDDPKMDQLYEDLDMLDRKGRSRIIVFTQYKDTMHFVRQQLRWKYGENIACYSGDGGEMYDEEADAWRNVGKERVKREFSDNDGEVDILVCTDSASEGLNLQECGAMINYDLPWNPMRVEQRIGRIDRIGQEYDDVYILNYSYEDTVESDIYDRLDDRIGLFEYVVGDMQPILSSVGSKIREATMVEGAKADSEEYEELERDIDQDIEEQQGEDDPVELKDSLAEVDSDRPLREQVIQEARLDAWETYSHPDLGKVGNPSKNRDPVFTVDAAKGVFLENETLTEAGIQFDLLSHLDFEFDLTEPEDAEFIYCLQHPGDAPITAEESEDTLAASIANQHQGIGVTFDPDTADEYPSLRFLAPGSPLFNWLAATLVETSDRLNLTQSACTANSDGEIVGTAEKPWVVTGWVEEDAADTSLVQLTDGGSVEDRSETVEFLNQWAQEFIENRTRSS
ncbi:helicase-related protein [Haloarcula onubensis]|uniref:SNF2-related protein n=1 Tax=Haloarcula onubensis TaxID=2950539 RepID=A0ABU2FW49_9EURY|nr:helicase-related protein [Halomicroarcula sp. S3CR25-11]MDS0284376.1 SNF2-related protein [Halomicroarcula sp. S3CR25-11]